MSENSLFLYGQLVTGHHFFNNSSLFFLFFCFLKLQEIKSGVSVSLFELTASYLYLAKFDPVPFFVLLSFPYHLLMVHPSNVWSSSIFCFIIPSFPYLRIIMIKCQMSDWSPRPGFQQYLSTKITFSHIRELGTGSVWADTCPLPQLTPVPIQRYCTN